MAEAVVPASSAEARVDMGVQSGDGNGVQFQVVSQEDVVVRMPVALIAPGELQRDDVPGRATSTSCGVAVGVTWRSER
jgi:hypothetical protein